MPRRHHALLALLFGSVLFSGCAPSDPLDTRISAGSGSSFMMWRGKIEAKLSPEERRELEESLQELRYAIMTESKGAPTASAIDQRLRARIDDRALRELFIEAARLRLARLMPERDELRLALAHNTQLVATDAPSAAFLDARIDRQNERLQKIAAEIEAAESRLTALGASTTRP